MVKTLESNGMHHYEVMVNTGTAYSCVVGVDADNVQTAIDMAVDELAEKELNFVVDYWDLYDNIEDLDMTVDEYAEANNLVCAGNASLYIGIDDIYEDGESIW